MKNIFKSEFMYLLSNEKVSDNKLLLADFNFSEFSICFCVELASKKIIGVVKPTFDYKGNTNIETNSKEVFISCYKTAMKNVGKEISTEDLISRENSFASLTSKDFKGALIENGLFDEFVEKVYSYNDKDLTKHINLIFDCK